jgi:hypothetical protein
MLGFFVVALDAQVVNVALLDIRTDLGGGLAGLRWVVTGYTLMFSGLLLFAGTFADRIGARRTYGLGMVLFIAASAACGLAPSLGVLVTAAQRPARRAAARPFDQPHTAERIPGLRLDNGRRDLQRRGRLHPPGDCVLPQGPRSVMARRRHRS